MRFMQELVHLAPIWHVEILPDGETALFISEEGSVFLDKPVVIAMLSLLNGEYKGSDIVRQLSPEFPTFEVVQALIELFNMRVIKTNNDHIPAAQAGYWDANRINISDKPLGRVAVHELGDGQSNKRSAALINALHSLDLTICSGDKTADLDIVLTHDYLDPALTAFTANLRGPVLIARPNGRLSWLGPLFVPAETACLICLTHRLQRNYEVQELYRRQYESEKRLPRVTLPTSELAGLHLIATQTMRWFVNPDDHPLRNRLLTLNSANGETAWHTVVKRPQCSYCGNDGLPEPQPVVLQSRPLSGSNDSGHRLLAAEAMLESYEYQISPITGIVPSLNPLIEDGVTHVHKAGHHRARPAANWIIAKDNLRNNASGKGVSDGQSRASALGEALERYSSQWDGTEFYIKATYAELEDQAIFPNDCMLFSENQFANRAEINRSGQYKRLIPLPLGHDTATGWVKAWSLTRQRFSYLAAGFAYFNYPQTASTHYFIGDSNGNAAGTSLEDAVLQGFLELVERESVALWWYNRLQRPGFDLAGINDQYFQSLGDRYARVNREFWVLDLTADLGIPACVALSRRTDEGPDQVTTGFGAHLDPRIAVIRAVTEMNQMMPSILSQVERIDRRLPDKGDSLTLYDQNVADHPYLLPDPDQPKSHIGDFNLPAHDDIYDEVRYCQEQVEAKGLEMFILDLTRPDIKLPVAKVIVPGMRHFWRRQAPGRLYDVPVQMGWLKEPFQENQLNPIELNG